MRYINLLLTLTLTYAMWRVLKSSVQYSKCCWWYWMWKHVTFHRDFQKPKPSVLQRELQLHLIICYSCIPLFSKNIRARVDAKYLCKWTIRWTSISRWLNGILSMLRRISLIHISSSSMPTEWNHRLCNIAAYNLFIYYARSSKNTYKYIHRQNILTRTQLIGLQPYQT